MDFESLKTQVENRILETYCAAEKYFGPCFDLPTVTYTLRGRVAGTASYPANTINFNKEIFTSFVSFVFILKKCTSENLICKKREH